MILITGADYTHFKTLVQYIKTIEEYSMGITNLVIYDLGLKPNQINYLNTSNIYTKSKTIVKFDYRDYPEWLDSKQRDHLIFYVWKSIIIKRVSEQYPGEVIVWTDSGNMFKQSMETYWDFVKNNGIYSWTAGGTIETWTHPKAIAYTGCKDINRPMLAAGWIGFNTSIDWVRCFIDDFYSLCRVKECIAPTGSGRHNHRQDTSVFTILYWKYHKEHNFLDVSQPGHINYDRPGLELFQAFTLEEFYNFYNILNQSLYVYI